MIGLDRLVFHVPELRLPSRRRLAVLIPLTAFALGSAAMIAVDRAWPGWTLAGQIAVLMLGFSWAGQYFWRRHGYRARWGERAYRNAFARHILPGLPLIFAALAHTAYLPGPRAELNGLAPLVVAVGGYLLLTGFVLWGRAGKAFGVDNGLMLYVYFPEESRMVHSSIYSLIRHPMYSGAARVAMALGLLRGTWFSLYFGLMAPLGMWVWARWVEEPELIERFGQGYDEFRRRVPAFWPRPRDAGRFVRFLLTGDTDEHGEGHA